MTLRYGVSTAGILNGPSNKLGRLCGERARLAVVRSEMIAIRHRSTESYATKRYTGVWADFGDHDHRASVARVTIVSNRRKRPELWTRSYGHRTTVVVKNSRRKPIR